MQKTLKVYDNKTHITIAGPKDAMDIGITGDGYIQTQPAEQPVNAKNLARWFEFLKVGDSVFGTYVPKTKGTVVMDGKGVVHQRVESQIGGRPYWGNTETISCPEELEELAKYTILHIGEDND